MTDDLETTALRPTVENGQILADDYEVIWRGLPVGRILKQQDSRHWWWSCNVYGQPAAPNDRGPAIDFKDGQVRFKLAWARVRPALTEEAIATAMRHAEGLRQSQQAARPPEGEVPLLVLENKRAAARHRMLKSGSIEFNGGLIDCVVRNISETGAALEVVSPLGVPDSFYLLISGDRRPCRVAWRRDKRIGVAFV